MTVLSKETKKFAGREKIASYFEGLFGKHGDSYLSLDWNSKASQELRYAVFMEMIGYADKIKDISVLDVGCGLGHFYDYLKNNGLIGEFGIRYSGIDISEVLIDAARKKKHGIDFKVVDLLQDRYDEKHDYVMASGIFNIRMECLESHKECALRTISRMFNLARVGMAVNFICRDMAYGTDDDPEASKYVYYSPEEMIAFCKTLSKKYILRHDYHPGDFTVYLFKH